MKIFSRPLALVLFLFLLAGCGTTSNAAPPTGNDAIDRLEVQVGLANPPQTVRVNDPQKAQKLYQEIHKLQISPADMMCTADYGLNYVMTFYKGSEKSEEATLNLGGCKQVIINGKDSYQSTQEFRNLLNQTIVSATPSEQIQSMVAYTYEQGKMPQRVIIDPATARQLYKSMQEMPFVTEYKTCTAQPTEHTELVITDQNQQSMQIAFSPKCSTLSFYTVFQMQKTSALQEQIDSAIRAGKAEDAKPETLVVSIANIGSSKDGQQQTFHVNEVEKRQKFLQLATAAPQTSLTTCGTYNEPGKSASFIFTQESVTILQINTTQYPCRKWFTISSFFVQNDQMYTPTDEFWQMLSELH